MARQNRSGHRAVIEGIEVLEPRRLLAATPVLVGDIDQTGDVLAPNNTAVQSGNYAYFAGNADGVGGTQLFRTDGTKAGTTLIKVINPTGSAFPSNFIDVRGVLYFTANDGVHGTELWKSDGTAAGTAMVEDLWHGATGSAPTNLVAWKSSVFFTANDGVSTGLFRADSYATGDASKIYDASTGGNTPTFPIDTVNAADQVFFLAYPSGGTSRTLYQVNNGLAYRVGGAPSGINNLIADGAAIYYTLDGTGGGQSGDLYRSTGNYSNTLLKSFATTGTRSYLSDFTTSGTYVYFENEIQTVSTGATNTTLWRTDGTTAGTISLGAVVSVYQSTFTPFGTHGILFLNRTDAAGTEPWVSDGTAAGTKLLKDLAPGAPSGASLFGGTTRLASGRVLFTAATGPSIPTQVWTTDGTTDGTKLVTSMTAAAYATAVGGNLNGVALLYGYNSSNQGDLFRSDGTTSGTVRVGATIAANGSGLERAGGSVYGQQFVAIGTTVYFDATDGKSGYELYKTVNGAAPVRVADLNPGGNAQPFSLTAAADGSLYFQASADGTTRGIYRIAPGGGTPLRVVAPGAAGGITLFQSLTAVGNVLYFTGYPPAPSTSGVQLWRYDPASKKTSQVITDTANLTFTQIVQAGSSFYFGVEREAINNASNTVTYAQRLYRLSSPTATPQLVKEIVPGPQYEFDLSILGVSGSTVYFSASTATAGAELWASDGTAATTRQVADLTPGTFGSSFPRLGTRPTFAAGGFFYFSGYANGAAHLYRTNGTAAGTTVISGTAKSGHDFVTSGGNTYFIGSTTDSSYGTPTIYRLNGTTATAVTAPGTTTFNPTGLFAAGGNVYAVVTNTNATELWQADAAFKSFAKVTTLAPGTGSGPLLSFTLPDYLFAATATDLYFPRYTTALGVEPYRLALTTGTSSVSGFAFDDANGNGKVDTGDKYTAGKTIFLDLDNDGILDANEPRVQTDSAGKFTFTALAAGTYHVRRVFATGYTMSTPKIDVTLTAGQAKTGLLIGTKKA